MLIFHFLISGIFVLFALLQLNDPDTLKWFSIYFINVISAQLTYWIQNQLKFKSYYQKLILFILVIHFLWIINLIPSFFTWWQTGRENLMSEMNNQKMYLEEMRELGGLFISLLANFYFFKTLSTTKSKFN